MKRWLLFYIAIIALSCSEGEEKTQPEFRPLVESVYASVTVQPDSLYQVYATVSGILEANLVKEGDLVAKNEALLKIINNAPELNAQNAKLALDLAQENYNGKAAILRGFLDQINAANLKYKNDSINYFRQKSLWEQKIGSKSDYDTKKLNYELSLNNLLALKNNYDRTKSELLTLLKQAKNNYQASLINTKDFTVRSAIKGKVYALYKELGEIVNTMEPLASVGSASNFIVVMLVDEVDIVKIQENQEVVLNLEAYDKQVFIGKISEIYPKKDERNQTFTVEAVFNKPPKILYPGLSGEANIVIAKKDSVLTIPKTYLFDDNKVKTDNGLVTITMGLQNMEYVEVLSGLSKETYIYKPKLE